MRETKDINEDYIKRKGLELVTLDLLGKLEKSLFELNSSKNQPIKNCWKKAVYDGTLKQVELFLEVCSGNNYLSNYQFRRLTKKYKEITGDSFKEKHKQKLMAI